MSSWLGSKGGVDRKFESVIAFARQNYFIWAFNTNPGGEGKAGIFFGQANCSFFAYGGEVPSIYRDFDGVIVPVFESNGVGDSLTGIAGYFKRWGRDSETTVVSHLSTNNASYPRQKYGRANAYQAYQANQPYLANMFDLHNPR